jgi:urease subunit alpha
MFGAFGGMVATTSLTFLSQAAIDAGVAQQLGLRKRIATVRGTRTVTKRDLPWNTAMPKMEIDAQTHTVRADGVVLTAEAAKVLPMAQRYFLF